MERTVRPKYICYLNNVGAEVHPYNENGALGICILQQAANPSWLPAQALHPQANILATAVDHGNITGICIFELYNVTLSWLSCTRRYMLDLWLIYNEKKKIFKQQIFNYTWTEQKSNKPFLLQAKIYIFHM